MLHHLHRTERLRSLFDYPGHPDAARLLPDILTAASQEVSEVLDELKPWYAWWDKTPIDRDKLSEELADVQFFYLLYVLHARDYCHGFRLDHFQAHYDRTRASGLLPVGAVKPRHTLDHLRDLRKQLDQAESRPYETLITANHLFWTVLTCLGISPEQHERAFLKKFLVNLQRTGKLHTDEGTALYLDVQQRLTNLEHPGASPEDRRLNDTPRMVA